MKKIKFYILLILPLWHSLFAQREDSNWIGGYSLSGIAKISFDTNVGFAPIMDTLPPVIRFFFNNAIISDKNANILFYTNGIVVMNSQNDTMQNGKDLSPCLYTTQNQNSGLNNIQGSLILPVPNNNHLYYLFHETITSTTGEPFADKLLYSIIDMNGDNGNGTVTQKNVPILSNQQLGMGKITACKHANGRDWWIIKSDFYADKYYKFLLQSDGLHGPYIQTFNDTIMHVMSNDPDQSGFTPDGSKYIHSCARSEQKVFIFNFDRCTGELSLNDMIKTQGLKTQYEIGCTFFSPNSRYMYFASNDSVYQYDLSNINTSKQLIAVYDGFASPVPLGATTFFMGLAAPNGKIYISTTNGCDRFHVINSPDSAGTKCDFQQHSLQLPKIWVAGLPNFPNYRLGALVGSACDTLVSEQSAVSSEQAKVYPNPAQEQLHIEMPPEIKGEYTFTLLTMQGQTILAKNMQKLHETIFVGEVAKGMYLYRIETNKENYYGKICIE